MSESDDMSENENMSETGSSPIVCPDENSRIHSYAESLLIQMRIHFEEQILCDVLLIAGKDRQSVAAHRLVLSSCSAFFKAMFTSPMVESVQQEVVLEDVYGPDLKVLIKHCYKGSLELQADTVEMVLATACRLQLDAAVVYCSSYLQKLIEPKNCLGILFFADQHSLSDLQNIAQAYIYANFMQVSKSEEFLQLSAGHLSRLINSDELVVPEEEDVFKCMMSWVEYDAENRSRYIPKLLPLLRLTLVNPSFIESHVKPVCKTTKSMSLANNAIEWHISPEIRTTDRSNRTRKYERTLLAAYYVGLNPSDGCCINVATFNRHENEWNILTKIKPNRINPRRIVVLKDSLLVSWCDDEVLCWIDIKTRTIKRTFSTNASGYGIQIFDNNLYIVGGRRRGNMTNSVKRFNLLESTSTFTELSPMRCDRIFPGVAILGKHLYVFGGERGSSLVRWMPVNTVERYDPETNTWETRAPMKTARSQFGIAYGDGFVYVVGGCYNSQVIQTVERYDPEKNEWILLSSLNRFLYDISCDLMGDCLIVVGSDYSEHSDIIVQEFNLKTRTWERKATLAPHSRVSGCKVVSQIPKKHN